MSDTQTPPNLQNDSTNFSVKSRTQNNTEQSKCLLEKNIVPVVEEENDKLSSLWTLDGTYQRALSNCFHSNVSKNLEKPYNYYSHPTQYFFRSWTIFW
jgi:hypothetical protein